MKNLSAYYKPKHLLQLFFYEIKNDAWKSDIFNPFLFLPLSFFAWTWWIS